MRLIQETLVAGEEIVSEHIGFAEYVRQALQSATYVGFTGTPIEIGDRDTRAVFGDVIDTMT